MLNNSRVIPARLMGLAEGRTTPIEVVLLNDKGGGLWECLTRPGKKTREGVKLSFGDGLLTAEVEAVNPADGNRFIRFHYDGVFLELLDRLGSMPLPPYIKAKLDDPERYQTVYSKTPGSAAAPHGGAALYQRAAGRDRPKGREAGLCDAACRAGHLPPGQVRGNHRPYHAFGILSDGRAGRAHHQ